MVILDVPAKYITMLRSSSGGETVFWTLSWMETHGKGLKMYVSPSFYFYELLHDILPIKFTRSIKESLDNIQEWMNNHDFESDVEDMDSEGFYGMFSRGDLLLNFKDFPRNRGSVLKEIYAGITTVEISRVQYECDVKISFLSEGPVVGDSRLSHECNIINMNKLKFSPAPNDLECKEEAKEEAKETLS